MAADCDAADLTRLMRTLDYTKFRDDTLLSRFGPPGKVLSLLISNGLYKGDYVRNWVADRLAERGVRTFGDLRLSEADAAGLPPEQTYKLVVVTADISKGELVYLPWDFAKYGLDPDEQLVADAVRASISIPYFYRPMHIRRNTFVDGAVLSNFPVDIFDTTPDWPTFGIKLSSKEKALQVPHNVTGPLSLASALFSTMMEGHDQRHLDDPCTQARTMFVDTFGVQATDFDIKEQQQQKLFASGQQAAQEFLQGWDFERFKTTCPPATK